MSTRRLRALLPPRQTMGLLLFCAVLAVGAGWPDPVHASDREAASRDPADHDGDGVPNEADDCIDRSNPASDGVHQLDADFDGIGNACDGDFDNDGWVGSSDREVLWSCLGQPVPGIGPMASRSCAEADMDGDGWVTLSDAFLFWRGFGAAPGPSGLACADATATHPACLAANVRIPDPNYHPVLARPHARPGKGATIGVDASHGSEHTAEREFTGFARLLRADGHVVEDISEPFTADCAVNASGIVDCAYLRALVAIDILVIANPQIDYSDEEAELVTGWLSGALGCERGCTPRGLLLVADHPDAPLKIRALADRLDLDWPNIQVPNLRFTSDPLANPDDRGLLDASHLILAGATPRERVVSVSTFTGSAFLGPASAHSLLTVGAGVRTIGREGSFDVEGYSQGMALEFGLGRVVASGEAGMFVARVVGGAGGGPRWMQTLPRDHNTQYLLNLMQWLEGRKIFPSRDHASRRCTPRPSIPSGRGSLSSRRRSPS